MIPLHKKSISASSVNMVQSIEPKTLPDLERRFSFVFDEVPTVLILHSLTYRTRTGAIFVLPAPVAILAQTSDAPPGISGSVVFRFLRLWFLLNRSPRLPLTSGPAKDDDDDG